MTKKLARLLKADIQETSDLKSIAAMLAGKGRGGDTLLAHITPKEVSLLKEAGGAGTVNPETGLLEFFDIGGYGYGADYASTIPDYSPPQNAPESSFAMNFNTPAQQLTSSGINPEQYYMEQAAGQQYAGSAFPYPSAKTGIPDIGWNEAVAPGTARDIALQEFPPSSAAYLNLGAQGAAPPSGLAAPIPVTFGDKGVQTITPEQPGLAQRATDILKTVKESGGDVLDYLKKNPELVKLGLSGAGALLGAQRAKGAAKDIQRSVAEQKAVGAPYQKRGQELIRAAEAGELTPQGTQALQAAQAQLAQGVAQRGGVGVAQAQAQVEALRQNLLQNQYNYGLQVAQIGDNIALGAIRTGMQMDQNLQQATTNFYTNLAAIAGGITPTAGRTT